MSSCGNLLALQGSANEEAHQSIESPDREHEKLSIRASKLMTQTKITSIYGSKDMKPNSISNRKLLNSEGRTPQDCIDVDNECISNHNFRKSQGRPSYIQVEEAERPYGMTLKTKRRQTEFTSPICESAKSPSSNEEASVDKYGNGFVTARTKLVFPQLLKEAS